MAMTSLLTRKTARQEFAEVLSFHRKDRGYSLRRVADMLGCSISRIEQYEDGTQIPSGRDWDKYKGIVDKSLFAFGELRTRAITERDNERDGSRHGGFTNTPLAAIVALPLPALPPARAAVTPKPEAVQEALDAGRTPSPAALTVLANAHTHKAQAGRAAIDAAGIPWRTTEHRDARRVRVREILEADPDALTKDVHAKLTEEFGVSIVHTDIKDIRRKVKDAARKRAARVEVGASPLADMSQETINAVGEALTKRAAELQAEIHEVEAEIVEAITPTVDPEANIRSAVELVLEAIPNLRSFTISVDDSGEASIGWKIREVRIVENEGAIKMGGRKS